MYVLYVFKYMLRFVYVFLKLFPIKNKVTLISRVNDRNSIDFNLLICELNKEFEIVKTLNHKTNNFILFFFYNFTEMYHIATSKACIVDSYIVPISVLKHKKNLQVIQIWHAMAAIKKFGYASIGTKEGRNYRVAKILDMHKNYDVVICGGKGSINHFADGFNINPSKVLPLNLPRKDFLLNDKFMNDSKKKIISKYNLDFRKPIILFAPTFRNKVNKKINNFLNECDYNNYHVIYKPHIAEKTKVEPRIGLTIIIEEDILELLSVVDFVVTDYSGVSFEAAIRSIPVFFYIDDFEEYKKNRGVNINVVNEIPELSFNSVEKMMEVMQSKLYPYKKLIEFRNRYIDINALNSSVAITQMLRNMIK